MVSRRPLQSESLLCPFFFSSRRRHTRFDCDWSSDVCSSDLNSLHPPRPVVLQVRQHVELVVQVFVAGGAQLRERLGVRPALKLHPVNGDHRADRKSTRLNSSHSQISYAVFCLKKKNKSSILHRPCLHLILLRRLADYPLVRHELPVVINYLPPTIPKLFDIVTLPRYQLPHPDI